MSNETRLLKAEIKRLRKKVNELSPSLEVMLGIRGFRIYKKEPSDDLIVPDKKYASAFYEKLKKYSFRLFLRDVIKHQNNFTLDKVTRFATRRVSSGYLDFSMRAGIAEPFQNSYRLKTRPIKSFGETLEWFVAKLVRNSFRAETIWGIKFKGRSVGGDYDLIAKIESKIMYMEIKSSPPKQIYDREIAAFFNRIKDLSPDVSIFFVDTELRMKDKIVPMFEDELRRRYKKKIPLERIVKELFHINRKIFIINAKGGIASNINTILAFMLNEKFNLA
jgi:hypothetical protein